jgi:secreted trypsin-like serine protease
MILLFVYYFFTLVTKLNANQDCTPIGVHESQVILQHSFNYELNSTIYPAKSNCSGTIIDNQYILTYSQCFKDTFDDKPLFNSKYELLINSNRVPIVTFKKHPEFDEKTLLNDIALVKFGEMDAISRACLPFDGLSLTNYQQLWIYGKPIDSETRKYFNLTKINSTSNCFDLIENQENDWNRQFCSLSESKCIEYFGGGLFVMEPNGQHYVVGIHTYGSSGDCNRQIFTMISAYKSWIQSEIEILNNASRFNNFNLYLSFLLITLLII